MKFKGILFLSVLALTPAFVGCTTNTSQAPNSGAPANSLKVAAALPDNGFKAQIDLSNPPSKLRAGEKVILEIHVKNASDVMWYARGGEINSNPDNRFYIAAGNRWLQPDGKLLSNMDGRYGLDRNLRPGEATTIPLQVTAPKDAGDYLLEIDLVQEQVAWFSDKGSPVAKTKIAVVR